MRLILIACSVILTTCSLASCARGGRLPTGENVTNGNIIIDDRRYVMSDTPVEGSTTGKEAAYQDSVDKVSPAKEALFYFPESILHTQCAAADYYPDHKVQPAFYGYPSPPEYERYLECLVAEARRDGGWKRKASASSFPKLGTCYKARITWIGSRFGDKPDRDAGTQVGFDIKLGLVDYSYVPAVARSKVGDRVRVCVRDLPEDCPADDLRGIGYRATNMRTDETWVMGDSQHMCRGA